MAYTPYYAPYSRPMGYYNPSIPQQDMQINQQMPVQQPIQQMPMQTPTQFMQTQPTNDMIWVLNENEATSYPVAPNNSVTLWDKNKDTVYIKSVNMQGVPSIRILDFVERTDNSQISQENALKTHDCKCGSKFVTKEDFAELKEKFEDLTEKVKEMETPVIEKPKATTKKAKEIEE